MGLSFFYLLKAERRAVLVEMIGYVVPGVLIDFIDFDFLLRPRQRSNLCPMRCEMPEISLADCRAVLEQNGNNSPRSHVHRRSHPRAAPQLGR